MAIWNLVKLGEIASITSSKRIFAKEYQTEGIPFYRGKEIIEKHNGNDVSTELYILRDRYEDIRAKFDVPKPKDILLTSVGTLGVPWLVDESEFYFKDGNLTWIRCNEKTIPEFLYLWFNSSEAQNQIETMCIGSTQKALTIEILKKFDVILPPLEMQNKICAIINPISNKIKTNTMINSNLSEQAQAYFDELFIQNASAEWKEGTLSDVGSIVAGGTPSKSNQEYYTDNGIAWITPKDLSVDKAVFVSHGENDITELGLQKSSATMMPAGTVLFSSRAPIGYIAIAANEICTNQGFKSVVPNDNVGTSYVYYLLKQLLPTIENMASGSTFKEISGSAMKIVPTVIPDDETLKKFSGFCDPIMKQIQKNEQESKRLVELRDSLLPKLMSGEFDVADLDI